MIRDNLLFSFCFWNLFLVCDLQFLDRANVIASQLFVKFMDSFDEQWRHIGRQLCTASRLRCGCRTGFCLWFRLSLGLVFPDLLLGLVPVLLRLTVLMALLLVDFIGP